MNEPETVFCLFPRSPAAEGIVMDNANQKRRRVDPTNVSECFLRIGFDQPAIIPSRLVNFGRLPTNCDVILSGGHFRTQISATSISMRQLASFFSTIYLRTTIQNLLVVTHSRSRYGRALGNVLSYLIASGLSQSLKLYLNSNHEDRRQSKTRLNSLLRGWPSSAEYSLSPKHSNRP